MISATSSASKTTVPTTTSTGSTSGTSSSTSTQAATPGGAMGKDAFMKLLIAQLQNQDPMNPMQGDQMATQLAQFSSLEQLQQINTNLTAQQTAGGTLLGAVQSTSAISSIGHVVTALGDQISVGGTEATTSVQATFATAAAKTTLHIYDSSGTEVATASTGSEKNGMQTINLGKLTDGLTPGTYTYKIDATDADGKAVSVQTYTTARIDGVSSGSSGIVLTAGGITIPYGSVVRISN
jgi:flagellar basal-body rod modification protein FlgD